MTRRKLSPARVRVLRAGLIELMPHQRGDEHAGRRYRLTVAGCAALDAHDAATECAP